MKSSIFKKGAIIPPLSHQIASRKPRFARIGRGFLLVFRIHESRTYVGLSIREAIIGYRNCSSFSVEAIIHQIAVSINARYVLFRSSVRLAAGNVLSVLEEAFFAIQREQEFKFFSLKTINAFITLLVLG